MTDLPAATERRQEPLRTARQSLGPDRTGTAEKRGQEMTLATASELAILLTGTDSQSPQVPRGLDKLSLKEREVVVLVVQLPGRTPKSPGICTSVRAPSAPG